MYKTILVLSLILCGLVMADHDDHDVSNQVQQSETPLIELTENNFVAIRGQIDESSASRFIADVMKLKSNTIYVYLTTPGGSVMSGMSIIQTINTLQASGKEFVCIADRVASMGFVILQACAKRHAMEHSIVMQHQVSLGIEGPYEQVKSYLKLIDTIDKKMNKKQAQKMGLTPEEFYKNVQHDWWLHGEDIVESGAADTLVNVVCNFDVSKTYDIIKYTFFGEVEIQFSLCPLIHNPTNIQFKREHKIKDIKDSATRNNIKDIVNNIYNEYTKFEPTKNIV